MSKTEGGEEESYFYTGSAILYTRNESGDLMTENILDPSGQVIASKRFDDDGDPETPNEWEDQYYFYHYDIRGSVTAIVKPDGDSVKEYTYDEFGNLSETGEAFDNEVTFTSSVTDTSTGLQYMNARFYDSTTGRFLSQDTYSGNAYEPWTQHLYSYCGNNPTNMVDPTGHRPIKGDDPFNERWTKKNGEWVYLGQIVSKPPKDPIHWGPSTDEGGDPITWGPSTDEGGETGVHTPLPVRTSTNPVQWEGPSSLPDYSDELNIVIWSCCCEFNSEFWPINGLVWVNGIFNHWDFVGDKWWYNRPEDNYYSYIPDDLQIGYIDKQDDYFIVNGHIMNREQYGNYVKGATACFAGIASPDFISAADLVYTFGRDEIWRGINMDYTNWAEDGFYIQLGYDDWRHGIIE